MKTSLLLCFAVCTLQTRSQDVQQIISAERSFAKYAADHNTRDAFLRFLDSSAVVFKDGNILKGKEVWSVMAPSDVKLTWQPAFAGIAVSGDLGFTTGPWQVRRTIQDTAIETGSFATVWGKTVAGEWKVIVDMGINYRQQKEPGNEVKILPAVKAANNNSAHPMEIEGDFLEQLSARGSRAFADFLHHSCWLNVEGYAPLISAKRIRKFIASRPGYIQYTPVAGGISSGNDLAYVYGTSNMNGKTENYLRVWQREKRGWKIVMMTGPVPH